MVHCTRNVQRRFPTFIGWNDINLKKRQKDEKLTGGFGNGYLTDTISKDELQQQKDLLTREENIVFAEDFTNHPTATRDNVGTQADRRKQYYRELVLCGKQIADAIQAFVSKLAEAPEDFRDNECFKTAAQMGRTLVGLKERDECTNSEQVETFTQAMEDYDLNDPEYLEALKAMMQGVDRRLEMEQFVPNFNLFNTQDRAYWETDGPALQVDPNNEVPATDLGDVDKNGKSNCGVSGSDTIKQPRASNSGQKNKSVKEQSTRSTDAYAEGNLSNVGGLNGRLSLNMHMHIRYGASNTLSSLKKQPNKENGIETVKTPETTAKAHVAFTGKVLSSEKPIEAVKNNTRGLKAKDSEAVNVVHADKYSGHASTTELGLKVGGKEAEKGDGTGDKNRRKTEGKNLKEVVDKASKRKGKEVLEEPIRTNLRSRATIAATEELRSPFNERSIIVSYHLNAEEKEVYYWVLSSKDKATYELVYRNNTTIISQVDIVSLVPYGKIAPGVVDGWSCYLNDMEKLKAPSSPSRLFFTTFPCMNTIVQCYDEWDDKMAMNQFKERLMREVKYLDKFHWSTYNLIFFPILDNEHYYLVCFNLLKPAISVIDNAKPAGKDSGIGRYGDIPAKLKKYFLHVLRVRHECKTSSSFE